MLSLRTATLLALLFTMFATQSLDAFPGQYTVGRCLMSLGQRAGSTRLEGKGFRLWTSSVVRDAYRKVQRAKQTDEFINNELLGLQIHYEEGEVADRQFQRLLDLEEQIRPHLQSENLTVRLEARKVMSNLSLSFYERGYYPIEKFELLNLVKIQLGNLLSGADSKLVSERSEKSREAVNTLAARMQIPKFFKHAEGLLKKLEARLNKKNQEEVDALLDLMVDMERDPTRPETLGYSNASLIQHLIATTLMSDQPQLAEYATRILLHVKEFLRRKDYGPEIQDDLSRRLSFLP